jgi:hypothetical protein
MPLIIWTVQRTGGTSLATTLARLFPSPQIEHEPFNLGRVWSGYLQGDDPQVRLRASLPALLKERPLVKHCCELHPHWLGRLLLQASIEAGYRQVVLIREDETARMMSLVFARRTGHWGKSDRSVDADADGRADAGQFDAATAVRHSRRTAHALDLVKEDLVSAGADHFVVSFEQLYRSNVPILSNPHFLGLAAFAGVPAERLSRDARRIAGTMEENDQGTRHLYSSIPDAPDIVPLLAPKCRLATGQFTGSRGTVG